MRMTEQEKMAKDLGIDKDCNGNIPGWIYELIERLIDAGWHK